jgi:mono/diheme cytochrome c family protein
MKKFFVSSSIISLLFIGCAKTNEETLLKNSIGNSGGSVPGCDTVDMKYAANILPILQANCYSCHGNGNAEGGVSLGSYNQVKQRATSQSLIGVITHASGYPAMPKGMPKLSDCNINKIKGWVGRGAPNN